MFSIKTLKRQDGMSMVEYLVLGVLIIAIISSVVGIIKTAMIQRATTFSDQINNP